LLTGVQRLEGYADRVGDLRLRACKQFFTSMHNTRLASRPGLVLQAVEAAGVARDQARRLGRLLQRSQAPPATTAAVP